MRKAKITESGIEASKRYVREHDVAYDRALHNWAHSQPEGNCWLNREIFRLKYPKDKYLYYKEEIKMMTIDEAIYHCNEIACKHNECASEHKQLAEWLKELKELKESENLINYINSERNKINFYYDGKEVSWNKIPLDVRKHDYPYYFKNDLDCYPLMLATK